MLRVTQQVGRSRDLKPGLPTPSPCSVLGSLLSTLELLEYLLSVWWPRHQTVHVQIRLETDINHMTTLSSFRRCGKKEHYESSLCLSPTPKNKTSAFAGAGAAQVTALGDVSFSRAALGPEYDLGAQGGVCVGEQG